MSKEAKKTAEADVTLRDVKISTGEGDVKRKVFEIPVFKILSWPLPIVWIDVYTHYRAWASSWMKIQAKKKFKRYVFFSLLITFTLAWLYFGGNFFLLCALYFYQTAIILAAVATAFVWTLLHEHNIKRSWENSLKQKKFLAIFSAIGFIAVCYILDIVNRHPFPSIALVGNTESYGRQMVFVFVAIGAFNIAMNFFCWFNFAIPDRSPLILQEETVSWKEFKDPTPTNFYLGANGKGYIPPGGCSFDFKLFERNFFIAGAPDLNRSEMVDWLLRCTFEEESLAICLNGGKHDDIDFAELRGVPGVVVADLDYTSDPDDEATPSNNRYKSIINLVHWLEELIDEGYAVRHGIKKVWRPENTRIVVVCDPVITDLVIKKNLSRFNPKTKQITWRHPLFHLVDPFERLLAYGKSHRINFICIGKHQYHEFDIPEDRRDMFYNIIYHYKIRHQLPDGNYGWVTAKTPPYRHTFGVHWKNEFLLGTAPNIPKAELANFIRIKMGTASEATRQLWDTAMGEITSRPLRRKKPRSQPIIKVGDEIIYKPRDGAADGSRYNGDGRNGSTNGKQAELEIERESI